MENITAWTPLTPRAQAEPNALPKPACMAWTATRKPCALKKPELLPRQLPVVPFLKSKLPDVYCPQDRLCARLRIERPKLRPPHTPLPDPDETNAATASRPTRSLPEGSQCPSRQCPELNRAPARTSLPGLPRWPRLVAQGIPPLRQPDPREYRQTYSPSAPHR